MAVDPIPAGYEAATPYLIVNNAPEAIEFYQKAFGAEPTARLNMPNGCVVHAELRIGRANIMLADENPMTALKSPHSIGGTPVSLLLYFPDVDAQVEQAVAAGATILKPAEDQFWGDRMATIMDPYGHVWSLATHTADVPQDEVDRRFAAMMGGAGG